ncbi:MAG: thioesterase family protein [Trueperaceae bacterium]
MDDALAHTQEITVHEAEIDEMGHVNNAVYLHWVDNCCRAHAERLGMPITRMMELGVVPVVRRHVATYRLSANIGEQVAVSTRIVRVRGPLATRHNEVRRQSDEALLVEVDTDWVWVDPTSGRPKAPPPEVMAAFGLDSSERPARVP